MSLKKRFEVKVENRTHKKYELTGHGGKNQMCPVATQGGTHDKRTVNEYSE